MRVSIVIPAFNEARTIVECVEQIGSVVEDWQPFEILIVDDGSTDATWSRVQELASADPRIRGLRFTRNFGKEKAIIAGLAESSGEAVVVVDADLQHPPELIPRMLERWRDAGVDIVEAVKSRRQRESSPRRLVSRSYYLLFHWLAGVDLTGATDYKLLDRKVVKSYLALPERNVYFRGLTRWLGYSAETMEFDPPARADGTRSRWSLYQLFGLAWSSLTAFSVLPLRLVTILGFLALGGAVILGAQTLWYRARGLAEAGFPTVILLQLAIGSIIMIGIGLLGEYLGRVYEELKRRPHYVLGETTTARDLADSEQGSRRSDGVERA